SEPATAPPTSAMTGDGDERGVKSVMSWRSFGGEFPDDIEKNRAWRGLSGSDEPSAALDALARAIAREPVLRVEQIVDALHHFVDVSLEPYPVAVLGLGREGLERLYDVVLRHRLVRDGIAK